MKRASITETKNSLSALLEFVKQGETILITERNCPIARIEPVSRKEAESNGMLLALERKGIVCRATKKPTKIIFTQKPPVSRGSALQALLEERETGR